jgi:hypothetical protein
MVAEILAHMGADVIKIERPRVTMPAAGGPPFFKGTSPGYLAVNANKRSITVDLKDKAPSSGCSADRRGRRARAESQAGIAGGAGPGLRRG